MAEQNKKSTKSNGSSGIRAFFADPRVKTITGLILAAFSAYLFLACVSYLLSGGHDQHLIMGNQAEDASVATEAYRNWMGKMGAHLAHFFMFNYLGVGSFFIAFVLFLFAVRYAFKKEILPFYKSLRLSIVGALYFPLLIGFIFHERVEGYERKIQLTCNDRFVGGYGQFATEWTTFTLGWIGTLMLLVIVFAAYLIFNHNHRVEAAMTRFSEWMKERKVAAEQEREQEQEQEQEQDPNSFKEEQTLVSTLVENKPQESKAEEEKKTIITPSRNSFRGEAPPPIIADLSEEEEPEESFPEPYLIQRDIPESSVPEPSVPITATANVPPIIHNAVDNTTNMGVSFDLDASGISEESPTEHVAPVFDVSEDLTETTAFKDFEAAPPVSPPTPMSMDDMEVEVPQGDQLLSDEDLENKLQEFGPYDPKLDLSRYELPPIDLLKSHGSGVPQINKEELEANKNRIVETLNHYKIEIDKIKATIGPTVTLYEIVPAPGVRISKIKNLEDDIALSLAALGIRIIAPIPGKGTIGIEVPNSRPDVVSMRSLIQSDKFQNSDMDLPVVLGKTISNENFVADLAKMPHLLMAGATGQGKSVGLNAILVSLLYKKHPSQIKFVLVDPKKVELTLFNKIERHFLAKLPDSEEAIITDTSKVVRTLNSLCIEMDERYELLKTAQCRNIKEYNAKFIARRLNPENGHRYLPYIVLVVDEFADLIMTAGREVETPIARLAQLARAIGIHLIIATQRPSVNIITGTIKANFPARIAFRVTSKIDSRTILDAGGADQLIGRGDMLYSTGNDLIRIQCGFVDTPEVEEITDFIGSQQGYPNAFILPEVPDENGGDALQFSDEDRDALFEDAARIVVMTQQGSTSMLQRKLKLGYNRAGRLVDQLEAAGIIGPFEGAKARKVLIGDEMSLEQHLRNLKNQGD